MQRSTCWTAASSEPVCHATGIANFCADQKPPAGLALHLIVDNYATQKTSAVKHWLKAHPRFHFHFTPTSWLNMVERFFAEITRKRIRRGAFKSVAELKDAITQYLEKKHNAAPKPFVWTKTARSTKSRQSETSVRVTTLGMIDEHPYVCVAGKCEHR